MVADGDCRREPDLTGMVQRKLPCLRGETLSEQLLDPGLFPGFLWAVGSLYCLSFSSCLGTSFLSGENRIEVTVIQLYTCQPFPQGSSLREEPEFRFHLQ